MKLLKLFLIPPALLCVGLIRLLTRFDILIRFGELWSSRIGHMAGNTECYLCEKDDARQLGIDIFYHQDVHANRYLSRMYNRLLHVEYTGFARIVDLCNRMFPGWQKHIVQSAQVDRDIYNLMEKYPAHLSFTEAEEARGRKELLWLGIPDGAKWVCLIVRDNAYLPGLAYHNHRDTDIDDYMPAVMALVERGYYVIRMGTKVNKALPIKHSHVIDYPPLRSEFMDIYLGAKCAFCISTGTGFDAIPVVFRRPIVYVNYVPLEYLQTYNRGFAIWQHHIKDGKRMSPEEIYGEVGHFMRADDFEKEGITLEHNSPEEITDVVQEMVDYVECKTSHRSQFDFWSRFPKSNSHFNGQPLHGHFRLRIGSKFLESYQ